MKRILCILSSLDAGGAETFLMKVSRALSPEEYQVDFVVSVENGCYTQEVLNRGGKIHKIPERTHDFWGAFNGIKSVVKDNHYDAVLKLGEHSLSVFDLIAAKIGGARHLAVRSCNAPTQLSWKRKTLHGFFRPILNSFATVKLAPSRVAAEFMFGKASDVVILNNGIDLNYYKYLPAGRLDVRKQFGLADKLVIGHIGRFHPQKNHRFLLEVFREIHSQRDDSVLLLVGIGDMEEQIRSWIEEFGLQSCVVLAGQRFDIPEIMSAMDVFLFPSLHEGMPNTVIEAQATGLPCVIADTITREAKLTELVEYLSLSDDPKCWAEKVLSVASKMREDTSATLAKQGYDIKDVAQELVDLLFD